VKELDVRTLLPAVLVAVALALASAPSAAGHAFAVPRAELITKIKTIGVMPVEIDETVPNPEDIASRLEQDIAERLQRGGFTVVPASEMRAVRARGLATLGGVYDPMTGLPNRERMAAIEEFSIQEYRTQHPVDATLRSGVVHRAAQFNLGWSEWDGVRERVTSKSRIIDMMEQGLDAGVQLVGTVPALSLAVSLVDPEGETDYTGVGGLLVLAYPTAGGSLVDYDLSAAAPTAGLRDPAICARALTVALEPLASGAASDKRLQFKLPPTAKGSGTHAAAAADLLHDHRRLVLASLELPEPPLERDARVRRHYHEMLAARFTALGFEVVDGNDFDQLWATERSAVGGFYDPLTGRADLAKLSTSIAHVLATLRERYEVGGVIIPSIVTRQAPASEGYARWDGVTESVSGGGSFIFNKSFFNANLTYAGHLEANSLKLRVVDGAGQVLYQGFGGVQLTTHFDHGRFMLVPESLLFADPTRDARAVDAALHAFAARSTSRH
jgi:hypothetical protein